MLHVGQGHPAGSVGCPLQHRLIYGPQSAGEAVGDLPQCADIIRQIRAEGVRVVPDADGTYCTTVIINGEEVELSDGAWGCVAYSAITSLYEADMAMAFEYTLDTDYSFNTEFQQALAGILSQEYMGYINGQNLTVQEAKVGFDLDGDGALDSTVALTIEYDPEKYPDTNGYGGTYLDLYLAEFMENLQWYVDNLDYADGWTWFSADGTALSDEEVAAMTTQEKAAAFIEGRYTKSSSGKGGMTGGPGGDFGGMGGNRPDGSNDGPGGTPLDGGTGSFPGNGAPSDMGDMPSDLTGAIGTEGSGDEMTVGTPDTGTTQASGCTTDSPDQGAECRCECGDRMAVGRRTRAQRDSGQQPRAG